MPIRVLRAKRAVVIGVLAVAIAGVSLAVTVLVGPFAPQEPDSPAAVAFAARGAEKVKAAYRDWVKQHDANGGDREIAIALGYWKALSASYTAANGMTKLNLIDGTVSVVISGLPAGDWDVWLVDNRPGPRAGLKPDSSDRTIRVGRLVRTKDTAKVNAVLGPAAFKEFHVDLVVVAPAGRDPGSSGLLFGSPPLFQRLYTALRSTRLLMASDFASQPGIVVERRWASMFGAPAAEADDTDIVVNEDVVFNNLVARGAELFINETFDGNGRTCETCHRTNVNFTIDVNSIASLRDDDPLFVAEFTPELAFTLGGPKFEVPILMRRAGLILENVDGTENLAQKFTMRGVPHTLGLRQSLARIPGPGPVLSDGTTVAVVQRTGWSGDGAPGTGTLREFAAGAVFQHFTKTLNRVAGDDFRSPTNAELNAMEAFQLSLGRQLDLVLPLALKDPKAVRGQQLFTSAGCNACHLNAGANAVFGGGGNRNFNTGVENQPDRPGNLIAATIGLTIPRDGGFGKTPGDIVSGFGNGTFNTPVVVEAADTGPFFHDNSVETIEGAVAFYNSAAFNTSPAGLAAPINIEATQVELIALFLRVINALDNIREATECATAAKSVANSKPRAAAQLLDQAIGDTQDAMGVLLARGAHTAAVKSLGDAVRHFERAKNGRSVDRDQINRGLSNLAKARTDIVN